MDMISVVPAALYFACCGVLGVRLLAKGLGKRQLPELGLGVFFAVGVCIGFLINSALVVFGWTPARPGLWAALAMLAANVGVVALLVFVWQVFRAEEGWAEALFWSFVASLALLTGLRLWTTGLDAVRTGDWVESTWYVLLALAFAWTTIECALSSRRFERQAALGMADPSVVRQFRLWTWAAALQVAVFSFITVVLALGGSTTTPVPSALIMVMCSVSTAFIWFGVFPSRRMRSRLAKTSESS